MKSGTQAPSNKSFFLSRDEVTNTITPATGSSKLISAILQGFVLLGILGSYLFYGYIQEFLYHIFPSHDFSTFLFSFSLSLFFFFLTNYLPFENVSLTSSFNSRSLKHFSKTPLEDNSDVFDMTGILILAQNIGTIFDAIISVLYFHFVPKTSIETYFSIFN